MQWNLYFMDNLRPVNFDAFLMQNLLLFRGCPLSEVKLYWHGPVGTTEFVLTDLDGPNVLCPEIWNLSVPL